MSETVPIYNRRLHSSVDFDDDNDGLSTELEQNKIVDLSDSIRQQLSMIKDDEHVQSSNAAPALQSDAVIARLANGTGFIDLDNGVIQNQSSLATLTQQENQRLMTQIATLIQVRSGNDQERNRIESLLASWSNNQANRARDFTSIVQSISSILESTQSRAHYTGTTIFEDIVCKETIDQGHFYCKVMADLSSATSHLKIELRSLGDSHLQLFVSTQQPYPDIRSCMWNGGNPGLYKQITISGRDIHAINGWYYMTIEASQPTTFSLKATLHIDENGRTGRTRSNSNGGALASASGASHKTIHDRIKSKIDHFSQNPEAKSALRTRILQWRKAKLLKQQLAISGPSRNIVEDNAAEFACLRYTPRAREAARKRWIALHNQRLESARTHIEQDDANLEQQQACAGDYYRHLFGEYSIRRQQILKKRSLMQLQKKWLIWIYIGAVHHRWGKELVSGRIVRQGFVRRLNAANVICKFVSRYVMKRRYRQARQSLLAVRSILRLCSVNNQIMMRHRATDIIKQFLESAAGVQNNLSTIIKNFRHRVLVLQKFHMRWKLLRDARLHLWILQWDSLQSRNRDDVVAEEIRTDILKETMKKYRRELLKNRAVYEAEMKDYLKKKKIEDAKRMINADGNDTGLKPPREPHLPIMLPKKLILSLIAEGRKRSANNDDFQAPSTNKSA